MLSLARQCAPIRWDYLTPQRYLALAGDRDSHPVAAIVHGAFAPPPRPWLQIESRLPPLDGVPCVEVWFADAAAGVIRERGFDLGVVGDLLIGAGRLASGTGEALTAGTAQLYGELLALLRQHGYPHLLRLWNVLERINDEEDGLERYRRFCIGRHEAMAQIRPDLDGRYPAASAIGSEGGGLLVYFIAARTPGIPVENPNQVSAFRYPAQYGPRSPSFSRALIRHWGGRASLFISGTASITGHETRHPGDLALQVGQTADNLETLVRTASDACGRPFRLDAHSSLMKAFVRRAEDYPRVRDLVARRLGSQPNVLYLRADICRAALLVEIDGTLLA